MTKERFGFTKVGWVLPAKVQGGVNPTGEEGKGEEAP